MTKYSILLLLALMLCSCSKKFIVSPLELKKGNYIEVLGFIDESNLEFGMPDVNPKYPDGLIGLTRDVNETIRYPIFSVENRVEGKVIVKYVIEKDGSIKFIYIEQSVSKELDDEAIRVIKNLKKWYPGFKNGKPLRTEFRQPFNFKLE